MEVIPSLGKIDLGALINLILISVLLVHWLQPSFALRFYDL